MTAIPANKPGSAEVHFTDLVISGDTDGVAGDLLVHLVSGMMYMLGWSDPPRRAMALHAFPDQQVVIRQAIGGGRLDPVGGAERLAAIYTKNIRFQP